MRHLETLKTLLLAALCIAQAAFVVWAAMAHFARFGHL